MSVFDADPISLASIVLNEPRPRAREISMFLHDSVSTKFCSLCAHFNVDPINPYALPTIILLMCKSRESLRIAQLYLEQAEVVGITLDPRFTNRSVDDTQNESAFEHVDEIFTSITDWSILLSHVDVELSTQQLEAIDKHRIIARMRESLREAALSQTAIPEPHFLVLCLFYMSPRTTLAPKMLERLCMRCEVSTTDLELKCMRFATRFMDATMDEASQNKLYVDLAQSLTVTDNFNARIRKALSTAAEASNAEKNVVEKKRMQLRHVAARLHTANELAHSQTFENWRASQKFGNVTSTQIQRLLYFIKVQEVSTPEDVYEKLFTKDILNRVRMSSIERIDALAVIDIIKSLRVYSCGIEDLLDFRTECLLGLSITARKALTLSHVAQLYISIFQHDSIWEECWRSVVNVMNHTIITARTKFRGSHAYDTRGVCSNIINCLVNNPVIVPKT